MNKKMPVVDPYLSDSAYQFYDTFFKLLGVCSSTPSASADIELGRFVTGYRARFIDMMINVPGTGGVYKQKVEMLDKYLPGWMEGR